MKKHTKALTGLAASVLALGAAGFGFSRWSSDLTLNGKVTAAGNWDVRISDASVISHSKSSAVIPAAEATVYPVYARAFNYDGTAVYRMKIDDQNPETRTVSQADLDKFAVTRQIPGVSGDASFYTTSNKRGATITYGFELTEAAAAVGFGTSATNDVAITDGGALDGQLIGYAIGKQVHGGNNVWKIDVCYDNAAAAIASKVKEIPAAVEVTVYDVYADYCTDFNPNWKEYRVQIDDLNPRTVTMTLDELNNYTYRCFVPGDIMVGYNNYKSGKKGSSIQYMMNINETGIALGFEGGKVWADNEDGSHDGALIGTAIGEHLASPRKNPWGIEIVYNETLETLTNTAPTYEYPAAVAEDGITATFSDVELYVPGAWAEYSVTVTNYGSVNADLADYTITAEGVDGVIETIVPEIPAGEVLKPGESCEVTFVAKVSDEYSENVLDASGTITVHVVHVQEVEEGAPAASHTHK